MTDKIEKIRMRLEAGLDDGSLKDRATLLAELDRLREETEQLRDILRRVSVHLNRDGTVNISFFSEGDKVTHPIRPQTSWALDTLNRFERDRQLALEDKP